MKNVIVLGGAGFIGINMMKFLKKKKFKILCVDKLTYASNKNDKFLRKIELIKCDINSKKICSIIKKFKPNYIINFAAETHVDRSIDKPKAFIYTNVVGVYNTLDILRKNLKLNIKYIHISTDEVYGDINQKNFSKEDDKFDPTSPYAASKAASDLLVKSFIRTYKLPAIITNCSNNFGPNQNYEKFIPRSIISILQKGIIEVYGKGTNQREWIFVEDHCEAIYKLMIYGVVGETYNIGSGIIKSNNEIAKEIKKIIFKKIKKNCKIIYVKDRPAHDKRYALNSSKLRKKIKWKPRNSFNAGLIKTINWYLEEYKNVSKININRQGLKI
jgi:dTDP-glucose 4,6-dehydratase